MILAASHEREHEREAPSNTPNEQLRHNTPDPCYTGREAGARNQGELEDQGTVAETISDGDRIGEGTHDTDQSGRSRGEYRRPGTILAYVDLY